VSEIHTKRRAIVVGAGFGGLSAAIGLAAHGWRVTVCERGAGAGGKAGVAVVDGVEVDTGPSVLTLPDAFDAVFQRAGTRLAEHVTLRAPDPAFRYVYPDGAVVDVRPRADDTVAGVARSLGADAARELSAFLLYARRVWDAAAPHFVLGPSPGFGALLAPGALAALLHIDPLRTMKGAIDAQVRSTHLRHLLYRYATYNGSDVRSAPATLNCIAHVELALGGFGVEGGIHALVRALLGVAERLGVELRYDAHVARIVTEDGRARGVELADGTRLEADAVVANADAAHVVADLLPRGTRHGLPSPLAPSTSGWTGILRARRVASIPGARPPRVAHTVIFPVDYAAEFADLFDRARPPEDPTVYLCAQEACHGRTGWPDAEPVFVMANAPAGHDGDCAELKERVRARLVATGLATDGDAFVWERTPAGLAEAFPGSRGSLYGAASNSAFAAFKRPPNRVPGVRGLYLASGSAHPGGGMPLCARSGLAAADAAFGDGS
jgi:phytoene desaturase